MTRIIVSLPATALKKGLPRPARVQLSGKTKENV
jgi:hypothetical protein